MNVETNDSSGANRTAAETTAAELLAAMATDSLLGKRSSVNNPSNSSKRTQSSSSSSSSQRSAVNDVDSADEREGNDSNQQVNAAESDDDRQLPQPRPLPGLFFETSRQMFADKMRMSPTPWIVSPKYHVPTQLSSVPGAAMFTIFTTPLEFIIFKVDRDSTNGPKRTFRILASLGKSIFTIIRVDGWFCAANADSDIGVMQLSPEGWLRCKSQFEADLVVSSALDITGVVPSGNGRTTMAQIVRPAAASSSTS